MGNLNQHSVLKGYNMLLYFAGSMIMFEPNEECITDFWTKGILRKLPVSSTNPNFIKAASLLRESCKDSNVSRDAMRKDYLRLFSPENSPLAPAYESIYLNGRLANGKVHENVSEFYQAYGWNSKFKGRIKDDHLGIELLFLTLMVEKYIEFDDDACRNEMKNEIRRFILTHIISWVPEWNKKVQKSSDTLSFKGVGSLIQACIEDILSILDDKWPSDPPPAHLKN